MPLLMLDCPIFCLTDCYLLRDYPTRKSRVLPRVHCTARLYLVYLGFLKESAKLDICINVNLC